MKTEAFENGYVKSVIYYTVASISVFGRFSVDDRRKRIKKYAFALVWTGKNGAKTLVWAQKICFVFVETKTETFENALVWTGPETPVVSHATPHFWRETQMKTLQARQVDLSRLRRSVGRFAIFARPLRSAILP